MINSDPIASSDRLTAFIILNSIWLTSNKFMKIFCQNLVLATEIMNLEVKILNPHFAISNTKFLLRLSRMFACLCLLHEPFTFSRYKGPNVHQRFKP